MNRRSFISSILAAAVAPQVLLGAGRQWKRTDSQLLWTWVSDDLKIGTPRLLTDQKGWFFADFGLITTPELTRIKIDTLNELLAKRRA